MFRTLRNISPSSKSSTQQYPPKSLLLFWLLKSLCQGSHLPLLPASFLQDSWSGSHDQSNHPPAQAEISCELLWLIPHGGEEGHRNPRSYLDQVTTTTPGLFYCARTQMFPFQTIEFVRGNKSHPALACQRYGSSCARLSFKSEGFLFDLFL